MPKIKPEEISDKDIQQIGFDYKPGWFLNNNKTQDSLANQLKQYNSGKEASAEVRWRKLADIFEKCENKDTQIARAILELFSQSFEKDIKSINVVEGVYPVVINRDNKAIKSDLIQAIELKFNIKHKTPRKSI